MLNQVGIPAYRELFASDQEFAVIDPRPSDHFQNRHRLSARNIPLEVISERFPTVVPSKATLFLHCDDNDGSATQVVSLLKAGGYQNLALLDGGIPAWQSTEARFSRKSEVSAKLSANMLSTTMRRLRSPLPKRRSASVCRNSPFPDVISCCASLWPKLRRAA